jgi:hypothetical protein
MISEKTKNKVRIQEKTSPSSERVLRMRQGDALSILLFDLHEENVRGNMKTNPGGTTFNRTSQCLAYADDLVALELCSERHCRNCRRCDNSSITDWLHYKCVQNRMYEKYKANGK